MKNITVAIPDEIYRSARIRAAEQGTSVSALVAEYLRGLTDDRSEFERLALLQAEIVEQIEGFSASDRLSRDEVHARGLR